MAETTIRLCDRSSLSIGSRAYLFNVSDAHRLESKLSNWSLHKAEGNEQLICLNIPQPHMTEKYHLPLVLKNIEILNDAFSSYRYPSLKES